MPKWLWTIAGALVGDYGYQRLKCGLASGGNVLTKQANYGLAATSGLAAAIALSQGWAFAYGIGAMIAFDSLLNTWDEFGGVGLPMPVGYVPANMKNMSSTGYRAFYPGRYHG